MITTHGSVFSFIDHIVRPLSRTLMRFGSSAQEFSDISRWSFVRAFYETKEFWRYGKPSAQQGSLKTGLPRVEVERLRKIRDAQLAAQALRMNRSARVLSGWVHDEFFHVGQPPWRLPVHSVDGRSFKRLVRKYGRDAPVTAIIDDLQRAGSIRVEHEQVTLINQAYGLGLLDEERLYWVGAMVGRLMNTTDHNLINPQEKRHLQRIWRQELVPEDRVAEALERIAEIGIEAGRRIDQYLATLSDAEPRKGGRYKEVGVGIYAFREPESEPPVAHTDPVQPEEREDEI